MCSTVDITDKVVDKLPRVIDGVGGNGNQMGMNDSEYNTTEFMLRVLFIHDLMIRKLW